jgi:hypothetical protein
MKRRGINLRTELELTQPESAYGVKEDRPKLKIILEGESEWVLRAFEAIRKVNFATEWKIK